MPELDTEGADGDKSEHVSLAKDNDIGESSININSGRIEISKTPLEDVLKHFRCTLDGLTTAQAAERLSQYGKNEIKSKPVNPVVQFLLYFWNPLAWAMEFAVILSLAVCDFPDAALVTLLLLANATIGYWEEHSSGKAVAALQAQLAPKATCLRDGEWKEVLGAELVPGDIVKLHAGAVVPADCKLLQGDSVQIDQSSLTGESLPAQKYTGDEVYSGSIVKKGEINALVCATGSLTFFGRAASLVQNTNSVGHFQVVLKRIGYTCIAYISIWVAVELIVQFGIRQTKCDGMCWHGSCDSLGNILVLIVGGIPVAMPTVLSVTMAIGAIQLAREQAIVTRLTAIEELAGMDILCSDKTGTLTLNELQVFTPIVFEGFKEDDLLLHAALSTQTAHHDAIDSAIRSYYPNQAHLDDYEMVHFTPFDPVSKRTIMEVKEKSSGKIIHCLKGAPQVVLQIAQNEEVYEEGMAQVKDMASRGYRTLGVAYSTDVGSDGERIWIAEGLIPLFDPPRHDTKDTIKGALEMGIRVLMITGDHLDIAKETARQLNMGDNILEASHLGEYDPSKGATDLKIVELVDASDGFAGVFPEQKYQIVEIFQTKTNSTKAHIVGMTGDGVNDAPALKKADIGIAVADATDAARAAADIVLLSPGLGVILKAIVTSRKIFQRMRNYTMYSITTTIRLCTLFGILTVAFNYFFPTLLVCIIAILNDGTVLAISKDRATPNPYPDKWSLTEIFAIGSVLGIYLTAETLVLYVLEVYTNVFQVFALPKLNPNELRALIYLNVSISGQATIFVTRNINGFWFTGTRPSWLLICAFILAQTVATIIAFFGFGGFPFDGVSDFEGCHAYVLVAWFWSISWFMPMDILKLIAYKFIRYSVGSTSLKTSGRKPTAHPMYGMAASKPNTFGSAWPKLDNVPQVEVENIETSVYRPSLDIIDRPWHDGDTETAVKPKKKKKFLIF